MISIAIVSLVLGAKPVEVTPEQAYQACEGERVSRIAGYEQWIERYKKSKDKENAARDSAKIKALRRRDCLVWPDLEPRVGSVGEIGLANIRQVVGPAEVLIDEADGVGFVMLRGIDTSTLADGEGIDPEGIFVIRQNTTYGTAIGGTKTVFVAEPYKDVEKVEALFAKSLADDAEMEQNRRGAEQFAIEAKKPKPRQWTVDGKPMEATFAGRIGSKVKLKVGSDSRLVELDSLSDEDREYIKSRAAKK